jgi:protein-S-isoprenylcysteine O-methyltransferase Ste14
VDLATAILLPAWLAFLVVWLVGATRTARTVKRAAGWDRALIAFAVLLALIVLRTPGNALAARFVPASAPWLALGALLAYGGIAFAVWARVHLGRYWSGLVTLKEGHELVRSGPYAIVRNPIYTGLLAAFLGSALVEGEVVFLAVLALMVVAFLVKIRAEEKLLRERFGDAFAAYEREVPRLVPGLW